MPEAKSTIKDMFSQDDMERGPVLDRVRLCCALSLPWLQPPTGQTANQKLPENYQSIGSRGIVSVAGQTLTSLFPAQLPWIHLVPDPEVYNNADDRAEELNEVEKKLLGYSIQVQSSLDATKLHGGNTNPVGFRTAKRQVLTQVFTTGDSLERMGDDLRLTVYRRDQYVTKRDSATNVLYHIIKEVKDPLALSDEEYAKCEFDGGKKEQPIKERLTDLYTLVEWNPRSKVWRICQEMNGHEINESEEAISPFFSTAFELPPGEDYGRGLIELNLGDLRSYNALRERMLDFAAMCSKMTPVMDYAWQGKPKDLQQATGIPIYARVVAGEVQDLGWLKVDKINDFSVVQNTAESIRRDLGAAMLLGTEQVRDSERTTAFEVQAVSIKEIDNVLGGTYAAVQDSQQFPTANRAIHVLQKSNKMPKFRDKTVEVKILTGVSALARAAKVSNLLTLADIAGKLGPETTGKLDKGVLLDAIARYQNIHEPGLIKSNKQMKQETEEALALAARAQAQTTAIDTAGRVAESTLTGGTA